MVVEGKVRNGTVLLEDGHGLPEGATVIVSCRLAAGTSEGDERKRVELPLVHSERPGSLRLTSGQVADFLEEGDVSS